LKGHVSFLNGVCFSPDGKRLATAAGMPSSTDRGEVIVWDVQTAQPIFPRKGHAGDVTSVSFSTDGKRLASAALDQRVKVWDAQTGKEISTVRHFASG